MIRFTLVINDDELNQWLEEQATKNLRSKSKQVEHLLKAAKERDDKIKQTSQGAK